MKNLRYDNEQCQSVAYEKASPELLRNKCGDMYDRCRYWQQKEPATESPADTEGIE